MTAAQHKAREDAAVETIRLTCPGPLVGRLATSRLFELFHAMHPGYRIEFVTSDSYLDLANGDVDLALRSGDLGDDDLIGEKVADSTWAVYASRAYVERNGRPRNIDDLEKHELVGFDGVMTSHRVARWLEAAVPVARYTSRQSSVLGLLQAVKAGAGVGPLPTILANSERDLVEVIPSVPELQRGWHLVVHPNRRQKPQVAAFFDFVVGNLDLIRPVLMG